MKALISPSTQNIVWRILKRYLLQIIEVQNGDYVEEDDIERFSDDYGRLT